MYITNNDFYSLARAIAIFGHDSSKFQTLKDYQKVMVWDAEKTLQRLELKKERDNKRTAKYIAEKRMINKNYGR